MTIGLLLAGGRARRMGRDKRSLRLGDQTLLERNLAFLQELFPVVAVSLRPGQGVELPLGGLAEVIVDRYEGSPLGGIATSLEHFEAALFVLAVDIAFPDERAVAALLDAFRGVDVALPIVEDKLEPLHAVYSPRCLPAMRRLLERGRHRVIDIFPDVRVATVPFPTVEPFRNVNTPEDFELARRRLEEVPGDVGPHMPETVGMKAVPPARIEQPGRRGKPALVAVVGKSDSGKTTLIERLIPELKRLGLRVGAVKHDVHGFEVDVPGKDSWRHGRAGADAYVVSSPQKLAYIAAIDDELALEEIAGRFFGGFDIVVAEGYKDSAPHKVEIFRREAGHDEPLCRPGEALALVTDADLEHERRFALGEEARLARFLA
ncbi:MAG TPA: molybdopterin-guanine dinucleotide biosynthesis protein B, partial [Thermoleophilia bacterium]|nr:molybdopterin-guanine dinucleotide biosynthesis protein B [Thermoleophilia bacterium]